MPSAILNAMPHGAVVRVVLLATSVAGLTSETEASLTIDRTPPSRGNVSARWAGIEDVPAELAAVELDDAVHCIPIGTTEIELTWFGFVDDECDTLHYNVAIIHNIEQLESRSSLGNRTSGEDDE